MDGTAKVKQNCYFLHEWNGCAKCVQSGKKNWPQHKSHTPGVKNMAHQPSYILPLQIKLGLMKNSTRTLDRNGPAFSFLCEKFQRLSRKIKVGIFTDLQICWLIKDPKLDLALSDDEKSAWNALRHVPIGFRRNVEAITFRNLVEDFTTS